MILSRYGISLVRVKPEHLELIRGKRNDPAIRKYMNFRETITSEMQQRWFRSISNANNFYYLIEYKGEFIGLVNDKNIDWELKTSEGGLFIWDQRYIASIVPLLVSLLICEMAFYVLGWDYSLIRVLPDNQRAIHFNLSLGFVRCGEAPGGLLLMKLTRESFGASLQKLRRVTRHLPDNQKLVLIFEPSDNDGTAEQVKGIMNRVDPKILSKFVEVREA